MQTEASSFTTTLTRIEFNPGQDQPRQHEAAQEVAQAEVQFKETLNAIGKCYNFYKEFANFIEEVEKLAAKPRSQVLLEKWQKLAEKAKLFQYSPGSQINRLDLADKLSSFLERDKNRLKNYFSSHNQESFENASDMIVYIKSNNHHAFSIPQKKAQEIETFCRDTFRQRSQELRERYHIGVYPENAPPSWAKEFGGSERFVQIKMSSYERLGLSRDASKEAIRRALAWDSDYTCYVNRADNVIIVTDTYRSEDARIGTYREESSSEARYDYAKTLPSSEVLFCMYQEADQHFREENPGSTPINDEITVIRHNISNEQTKEVLYKLDIYEGEKKIYHKNEKSDIFQELANTPNGRPLFFALAQHPERFDRLEVDRIEVRNNYAGYHMILYASLNDNYPQVT